MNKYFSTFPKIKQLMDQLVSDATKTKIAVSPLDGRIIDLSAIDWDNRAMVAHKLNQARNLPFQGAGATITKLALVYIDNKLKTNNYDAQIVNVVHDIKLCCA